jgi:ectoine hydroxylase-related dioxygenase (phytanoyl-CoA dioxygenase family)
MTPPGALCRNLLTITYLSPCKAGHGSTRLAPRSHRTPDGKEGPVRPREHHQRAEGLDPPGVQLRSLAGAGELEAVAVVPSFEPGDVVIIDSWLAHRVESNADPISKIGLINVFCRPDCVPTDPDRCGKGADLPVMRDGMVLPPTGYAAVEAEAEAAEASPAAKL